MKHRNKIHFRTERIHIMLWAHRIYVNECIGTYVPRLGGWA